MTREEIKAKLVEIVADQLDVQDKAKISDDARLMEDLGADSLAIAELVMEIEDHFDIKVADEAEGRIKTVGEVVAYIDDQIKKKGA